MAKSSSASFLNKFRQTPDVDLDNLVPDKQPEVITSAPTPAAQPPVEAEATAAAAARAPERVGEGRNPRRRAADQSFAGRVAGLPKVARQSQPRRTFQMAAGIYDELRKMSEFLDMNMNDLVEGVLTEWLEQNRGAYKAEKYAAVLREMEDA